jgi:nitroreductase
LPKTFQEYPVTSSPIDFLLSRKSPPVSELSEPGPGDAEIETMIRVAVRVPDHGRLTPWRFILYRGDARHKVGEMLAELAEKKEGPLTDARREQERTRLSRAPLVIAVVSVPRESIKIPQWEMFLSGGAAAMNLSLAAKALGYGATWVTYWFSDDAEGRRILGLSPDERVVALLHIGTHPGGTPDRPRPEPAAVISDYSGPWEG